LRVQGTASSPLSATGLANGSNGASLDWPRLRAHSSAGERPLHTREVAGSIPAAPIIKAPRRAARIEAPPTWDADARDTGSRRPRWYVEHDGGRAFVEKSLDELHERVWILKVGIRIEARGNEEFSVALDASINPPRPHFLTLTPAPDLYSGHASPSFRLRRLESGVRVLTCQAGVRAQRPTKTLETRKRLAPRRNLFA
jgi:hypothetical protein